MKAALGKIEEKLEISEENISELKDRWREIILSETQKKPVF